MSTSANTNRRSKLGMSGKFMGLTGKVVTVLVGPTETPFCIHWGLLTSKSSFFNAALTGPWQESTEGKVELADEDPELFSIYVLWRSVAEPNHRHTLRACCTAELSNEVNEF
ncbi:MAG: hypothetical protein Q9226_009046 [Calogaya cf. arnoldii]